MSAKESTGVEPEMEWLAGTARVRSEELAEVLVPGSEWAFLADLDPRTIVLWRIARRLACRERLPYEAASNTESIPVLWHGDAMGLIAEFVGMERGELVGDLGRLLALETLRLACCPESAGCDGKRGLSRRRLLRIMGATILSERQPLRAWGKVVRESRQARRAEELKAACPSPTANVSEEGLSIREVAKEQQASLAAYDGDGARPLAAKAILPQMIVLYQVRMLSFVFGQSC